MEVIETKLSGLKVIQLDIFRDERGFFVERFNEKKFVELGIKNTFVQDNHSTSSPGVIRGLHYQFEKPQAKLVGCIRGKILDVAVDIRKDSKTFGEYFSIELSADKGKLLFIPAGFAHGFSVIGNENADVIYKVDDFYNGAGEGGIKYDDEKLNIDWKVENPKISDKDKLLQSFSGYCKNPSF